MQFSDPEHGGHKIADTGTWDSKENSRNMSLYICAETASGPVCYVKIHILYVLSFYTDIEKMKLNFMPL